MLTMLPSPDHRYRLRATGLDHVGRLIGPRNKDTNSTKNQERGQRDQNRAIRTGEFHDAAIEVGHDLNFTPKGALKELLRS